MKRRPGRPRKLFPSIKKSNTQKKRKKSSKDDDNDEVLVETREETFRRIWTFNFWHREPWIFVKRRNAVGNNDSSKNNNKSVSRESKKSARSTSKFRGVTHHCRTGTMGSAHLARWETNLPRRISTAKNKRALWLTILQRLNVEEFLRLRILIDRIILENSRICSKLNERELILSLRRQSKGSVE